MILALVGISMPIFWIGLLLILLFSYYVPILPTSGYGTWRHLVLPSLALGLASAALVARMTRSSMLEILSEDYVRTARAKGLDERRVIYGHALRNAAIPIITTFGLQFGLLLGGSVIVETVFAWPGLGRLVVSAILSRDAPVVAGAVLLIATNFVVANVLVDILYGWADPRIRYS
jgi:ABC-type dipeptide/oligopeptide/nickel transport system permease component